jgi:hypothetical protein
MTMQDDIETRPMVMRCRLEVRSDVLGNSVFWEGTRDETNEIRSIAGRCVADAVFRTGEQQTWGMWHGYPCACD